MTVEILQEIPCKGVFCLYGVYKNPFRFRNNLKFTYESENSSSSPAKNFLNATIVICLPEDLARLRTEEKSPSPENKI